MLPWPAWCSNHPGQADLYVGQQRSAKDPVAYRGWPEGPRACIHDSPSRQSCQTPTAPLGTAHTKSRVLEFFSLFTSTSRNLTHPSLPAPLCLHHHHPQQCAGHLLTFCSVTKSCLTLCYAMDCSTLGFLVFHYLPTFAQIHVH